MNKITWMISFTLLVIGLGCEKSKHPKMTVDPNSPPKKQDISLKNEDSIAPNTPPLPITYTLSGSLGVGHVTLKGLPGDPNTLANGTYSVDIEAGWFGTVTPEKEGFLFIPPTRTYLPFTRDIHHEIYIPQKIRPKPRIPDSNSLADTQTLTGTLFLDKKPISGLTIRTLATEHYAVTDANGVFELTVPSQWHGTLRIEPSQVQEQAKVPPQETQPVLNIEEPAQSTTVEETQSIQKALPPSTSVSKESFLVTLGTPNLPDQACEDLKHDLKVMCQILSEQAYGVSLVKRDPQTLPQSDLRAWRWGDLSIFAWIGRWLDH